MYAYRKLAREEGLPEAVFMDDYQLNIEKMSNGQVFLIGKLSVIGQRINNLLQKAMNEGEGEQQPSHHNPISLTPSGIPMQQPEALKPVVNSEQALKAIQEDPLMKLLRRESE